MSNMTGKVVVALAAAFVLGGCTEMREDKVNGNAQLQVRMTDAPGNYSAVFIEIEDVLIHRGSEGPVGEEGWESIEGVKRGIYNLLDLVNGRDTLLVDANVPPGQLGHLRLVLGDENRIETGGKEYELSLPPALQAGVNVRVGADLQEDLVYEVLLDFDIARSVVKTAGGNEYILRPVIRVLDANAAGGTVRGVVNPGNVHTAVLAVKENDTLGTYTDTLGNYMLKALPPGSYSIHFFPDSASGLLPLDTPDIAVDEGEVSQVNVTLSGAVSEISEPSTGEGPPAPNRKPAGR